VTRRPPRGFATWSDYYRHRVKRGEQRGLTRAQSRGHPGKGQVLASRVERERIILSRSGPAAVTLTGVQELTTAAKFDNDVRQLLSGRLTPKQFDQRWARKTIGGEALPDSGQVIALGQQGLAHFDDFYPSRP
jgi:hypothetical protein